MENLDLVTSFDRTGDSERENLKIVLGAYRSFRGARRQHLAYVSMPITTGKRMYDVMDREGVTSLSELDKKLVFTDIIQPNIAQGIDVADRLGLEMPNLLFIAPSVFNANPWKWSQDAYMSLWYRVIGEMAGHHYLMDGWEYSVGGVKEVAFTLMLRWVVIRRWNMGSAAQSMGFENPLLSKSEAEIQDELQAMRSIKLLNEQSQELEIEDILEKVIHATQALESKGIPATDLKSLARDISFIPGRGALLNSEAMNRLLSSDRWRRLRTMV